MFALLAVPAVALLSGCDDDYRARATGPEGVLTIVMDSSLRDGPVEEAVRDELGGLIPTLPRPEPHFNLEFLDLAQGDILDRVVRKRKNVVFVGPLDGEGHVSRFIRARIDSTLQARIATDEASGVFQRPNLWYRDQMVLYVTARDENSLAHRIRESGNHMRYVFNTITRGRVEDDMFASGRQRHIEEELLENHDFAVKVQHDYVIAQDTANFVRMRRVLPDTWRDFFVYYIDNADPSMITTEWILDTRDELTERYVRGTYEGSYVKIDRRRPIESENINFLDRYGYETRGLWHMTNDAMGGGFVNYTFYDEEQRRIYMLDGMVFAPRYDKREFVRQVEVISHTFRTAQESQQEQLASSN